MKTFHALLLSFSLVLAAAVFGALHYASRVAQNELRVTGAATEAFTSDTLKWRITIARVVGQDQTAEGYRQLKADAQTLTQTLQASGVKPEQITPKPATSYPQYDQDGQPAGLNFNQEFYIISQDVDGLEKLAINPDALFEKGLVLQGSYLEYFNSNIDDLKHKLLSSATLDAQRRAGEIVSGTGRALGPLTSARVGVFQITEPFSTEISDYGVYSTATRDKEITVTVHATFALK